VFCELIYRHNATRKLLISSYYKQNESSGNNKKQGRQLLNPAVRPEFSGFSQKLFLFYWLHSLTCHTFEVRKLLNGKT
jgi:hypothetical protein